MIPMPPDEEILYSAQVEIHAKRGGPQVVFPKADESEVKELFDKKKEEYKKRSEDEEAVPTGVHVPPASENKTEVMVAGSKMTNKAASTPGAAPVFSDTVAPIRTDEDSKKVTSADGTKPDEDKKVVDPASGVETDISATPKTDLSPETPKREKTPEEIAKEALASVNAEEKDKVH